MTSLRPRPKWIPGIHLGRLGWFMAVINNRLVPGIEKYHEVIKNDIQDFVINSWYFSKFYQISPFQQKDWKISSDHVTQIGPCHWFKLSSHEEYIISDLGLTFPHYEFSRLYLDIFDQNLHLLCRKFQFWSHISKYRLKNSKCGKVKPRSDIL